MRKKYRNQGGVLLHYDRFGRPGQINNDIGHLSLRHIRHGISEVPCSDLCQEKTQNDMVSDTNPMVKNAACPDPETVDPYDAKRFKNTPFRNYMSYIGD